MINTKNIELKARRQGDIVPKLLELSAEFKKEMFQKDTYYRLPSGRMKLRESEGASELILYSRSSSENLRVSNYRRIPLNSLKEWKIFLENLFVKEVVVEKSRSLWMWNNVRIHVDHVLGLGDYVEFEALVDKDDEASAFQKCEFLLSFLDIDPCHIERGSYRELLMQNIPDWKVELNTLIIRPICASDTTEIINLMLKEKLVPESKREELHERLNNSLKIDSSYIHLLAQEDERIVALAEIQIPNPLDNIANLSHFFLLCKEDHQRGIGTDFLHGVMEYAFYFRKLRRLSTIVCEKYMHQVKMMMSAGFSKEGQLKNYFRDGEEFWDGVYLAVQKEEIKLL